MNHVFLMLAMWTFGAGVFAAGPVITGFFSVPPDDSCALAIKWGECETWTCDSSRTEICHSDPTKKSPVSDMEWDKKLTALLDKSPSSGALADRSMVNVPNDSCSKGFFAGPYLYLGCDSGYYAADVAKGARFAPIEVEKWNAIVSAHFVSSAMYSSVSLVAPAGSEAKKQADLKKSGKSGQTVVASPADKNGGAASGATPASE